MVLTLMTSNFKLTAEEKWKFLSITIKISTFYSCFGVIPLQKRRELQVEYRHNKNKLIKNVINFILFLHVSQLMTALELSNYNFLQKWTNIPFYMLSSAKQFGQFQDTRQLLICIHSSFSILWSILFLLAYVFIT